MSIIELSAYLLLAAASGYFIGSSPGYLGSTGWRRFLYWYVGIQAYPALAAVCYTAYGLYRFDGTCQLWATPRVCAVGEFLRTYVLESLFRACLLNIFGLPVFCFSLLHTAKRLRSATGTLEP
jgi:hypothetical protein